MKNNIYYTLNEAAEEIKKRWSDKILKRKVEEFLSNKFIPGFFMDKQRAVYPKSVVSPSNAYDFFLLNAKYLGIEPLLAEYTDDLFTGLSEDKLLLTRLRLLWHDGTYKTADIVDYKKYHEKKLPEVRVVSGEKLIDFHHTLFKLSQYPDSEITDMSNYFRSYGKPKDFYPYYLANFICHGILFEKFETDPKSRELKFTREVVMPSINFLKEKFGVGPIVVNLYSNDSTGAEDSFWGCFNRNINDFLVDYVNKNNCVVKELRKK
jgi:hypothetical protein